MDLNVLMCTYRDGFGNKRVVTLHTVTKHFSVRTERGISLSVGDYYHLDKVMSVKEAKTSKELAKLCGAASRYKYKHTAV